MRTLFNLGVALSLLAALPATARADVVRPELDTGCNSHMSVETWTPADGAPARWVADRLRDGSCDVSLVLGASAEGVWTVEGTVADASGYCRVHLALTKRDGSRDRHELLGMDDEAPFVTDVEHQTILSELWRLNGNETWPASSMTRPSKVVASSYDPEDPSSRYPGYLLRVEDRKRIYDYRLEQERRMCWCFHSWTASVRRASP